MSARCCATRCSTWSGRARSRWQRILEPAAPELDRALEELEVRLEQWREVARGLLSRVFEAWVARHAARYHEGLRAAFRQLCAMVFEGVELRALVAGAAAGPEGGAGEQELQQALNRAYTAHKRLRQGMQETLASMAEDGRLSPSEGRLAQQCLALFFRSGVRSANRGSLEPRGSPR